MPTPSDPPPDPPAGRDALAIGLLNLLPDAGARSGDRRLAELLRRAGPPVRLHRIALPSLERSAAARGQLAALGYRNALPEHPLDGLVVTGAEPRAADLADEAFWPDLTAAIDWAKANTRSTLFSCLAAHAAVRHLDRVPRRRLATKCFGLFPVAPAGPGGHAEPGGHAGMVSHSRWHDLDEGDLVAAGYLILARMPDAVDSFAKRVGGSRFLFLQGHPEYGAGTLGREYRRDVERFREGTGERYPELPVGYYAPATEALLRRIRDAAERLHEGAALPPVAPPRRAKGADAGAGAAVFGGWLRSLAGGEAR